MGAARFGAQTYVTLTKGSETKAAASTQAETPISPVPDAAKSTGKLFLVNWFFTAEKETAESKMERLEPYISPQLEATIRDELIMDPLIPNRVEPWDDGDQWIEKGKKANLKYQVILEDGRTFIVSVKVVKAGQWMVDSLPGLVPDKPKKSPSEPSATIEKEKLAEIQSALDAFFPMWLAGKKEALNRFAADGAKIDIGNVISQVEGTYEEVAISPASDNPLQVRALVKLRRGEETLSFEYLVTLTEQEGQIKIQSIQ